jgi:carbamoyltransferase
MLFVHDVAPEWRDRIPTVTHVDGSARIRTVDRALVARMRVNASLNTAGRRP